MKVSEAVYRARRQKAVDVLGIDYLLGRKIIHLSNGEARKVLIARALMQSPKLLILDDPLSGLDYSSRDTLQRAIDDLLAARSPQVLLITPRLEEIRPGITHILRVADCQVVDKGPKSKSLPAGLPANRPADRQTETPQEEPGGQVHIESPASLQFPISTQEPVERYPILVDMKDTSILYGETQVLHSINWTMRQGENWAVLGPNGAGKTTLLSLILADNPQSYANEIALFGKRRGSGESIWNIKQKIGWVSPELQVYYQKETTCHNVVCSGLFDSIGLYKTCSPKQARVAKHWLSSLGIPDLADRPLGTVSAGEQRLVFLARALVKNPPLLILDEPCQGLDLSNRTRIIDLLDQLCLQTPVNLIFVTHHFDEMPQAITHVLKLEQGRIQGSGQRRSILG
jgi:molybdate transport system ATP-binding protein